MGIRRDARTSAERYTIVANDWARDRRLSYKARGLLLALSSHAVGFTVSIEALVAGGPDGPDSVRSGLRELEALGYLTRDRLRDERGRLGAADYILSDPPLPDSPTQENPPQGNPPLRSTKEQEDQVSEGAAVAAAAQPTESAGQRANRLTKSYTDRVPLSRFPAIAGIVRRAMAAGYADVAITDALVRLATEGRSVTVETLRVELEGIPPNRFRRRSEPVTNHARPAWEA
jgi:hypothetical protein